ncbi:MAG: hypothetical protein ABSE50_05265 [Xanthobacteraceae bacterium]|jgi:hypothetical protein
MSKFALVSEQDLARARTDPAFRQRLLSHSMEVLLDGLKRARKSSAADGEDDDRIREGAQLAVRLAEIIQAPIKS